MSEAREPSAAVNAAAADEMKSDAHAVMGTAAKTVSTGARAAGHYAIARPIAKHEISRQVHVIQDISSLAEKENGGLDGPEILRLHTRKGSLMLSGDQQSIQEALASDSRLGLSQKHMDTVYGQYAGRITGAKANRTTAIRGIDAGKQLDAQEALRKRALGHDYRLGARTVDEVPSSSTYVGRLSAAGLRKNLKATGRIGRKYFASSMRLMSTGDEDTASVEQGAEQTLRTPGRVGRFGQRAGRTLRRPGKMFASSRKLLSRGRLLRAAARKGAATGKLSLHETRKLLFLAAKSDLHAAFMIGGGGILAILFIIVFFSAIVPLIAGIGGASTCDSNAGAVTASTVGAADGVLEGSKISSKQGKVEVLDYRAMKVDNTPYGGGSGYAFQQCTWWAAKRLETLGLKVPSHLGNGGQWGDSLSRQPGWSIVTPGAPLRLGDVVSFHGGALGSSPKYGHVAIVEKTKQGADDHDLWLSEGGTGWFKRYQAPVIDERGSKAFHDNWIKGNIVIVRPPAAGQGSAAPGSVPDPTLVGDCIANPNSDDPSLPGAKEASKGQIHDEQEYALSQFGQYGWNADRNGSDFKSLIKLFNQESGWNPTARNPSSGAYGIPQSLPGNKMASEGSDWATNWKTQINWGLKYIKGRYKTPTRAWNFHLKNNWY